MFAKSKGSSSTKAFSSSLSPAPPSPPVESELARRMARPQRHRLLHGYPMAPLLAPINTPSDLEIDSYDDPLRPLIVGVLPHTFCNPSIKGCGFCTFPHEKHSNAAARITTSAVAREVRSTRRSFTKRQVPALYFGGGTANLTPPDVFQELVDALEETFDLRGAEVSLEGAPIYFLTRSEALLDILSAMNVRQRRISLGIQTFDPQWIARMGRSAFGDVDTFAAVVRTAHARGMTTSCDLLYNLPGQSKEAQIADVQQAIDLGFDQICIYNLVLDASIDSEWAHDRSLLTRVAKTTDACDRWLTLRDLLLLNGYRQTTLTNFERRQSHSKNNFLYERLSFDAATNDALGFGPGAISTLTSKDHKRAIKWMNIDKSAPYAAAIQSNTAEQQQPVERAFHYNPIDLRLLHITRALSALEIDRARYESFFGSDILEDFKASIEAAASEHLLTIDKDSIILTPRGMFYADAVAGLIASRRARDLRHPNDAIAYAMG